MEPGYYSSQNIALFSIQKGLHGQLSYGQVLLAPLQYFIFLPKEADACGSLVAGQMPRPVAGLQSLVLILVNNMALHEA